jgi:hypothetical protein
MLLAQESEVLAHHQAQLAVVWLAWEVVMQALLLRRLLQVVVEVQVEAVEEAAVMAVEDHLPVEALLDRHIPICG